MILSKKRIANVLRSDPCRILQCMIVVINLLLETELENPPFDFILVLGALLKFKFSKKTYLIVIKDETGLRFKKNDSTLFLIGSYA